MKTVNTYSTQYILIQSHKNDPNPHGFVNKNPRSFANKNPQSFANRKKISKDRQDFINNIAASGFKQFHA